MSFNNKVVIVTGASSGIGAETAIEFAKSGAQLVITGRNEKKLREIKNKCDDTSPLNLKALLIVADLDRDEDIAHIIKETIEVHHKIDILVNNAGIFEGGSIETTKVERFDAVMKTNVRSVFILTKLATEHLVKSKGNIVNVSSVVGLRSFPNILAYCMSKAALDQFTRCVALELGNKGVRVNSVNPGVITTGIHVRGETKMTEEQYAVFLEKCKSTHALGKTGTALEVANSIMFLASNAASNITGVTLEVDGGRHAMCPR